MAIGSLFTDQPYRQAVLYHQNIAQSSTVSSEISHDISEVTQAASEISNSSSQISMSAEALNQLAQQLNDMVGRFKV